MAESGKCRGFIVQIRLTDKHPMRNVDKAMPLSEEGAFIGHLEDDHPWGRIMPSAAILRMFKGKRKGRMNRLCGLQPRREIVANNDVQLDGGIRYLLECHEDEYSVPSTDHVKSSCCYPILG